MLSITSTLHVYHTVLGALSGTTLVSREADLLPVECLQWCSPRMPCCRGAVGALQASATFYTGVFSLSGSPLWSWPVASWTQRVHKKRKQSGEKGRGLVLIARHKARFSHSPGNTDRWWSLNQQRPQCWTCGRTLKTRSLSSTAVWGKRDVWKTELLNRGELEMTAGVDG